MDFLADTRPLAGDLTELRHRLHRHPEIGLHLPRTQEAVFEALEGLGLELSTGDSCSSVVGVLRGTAPGDTSVPVPPGTVQAGPSNRRPVVLLRGDMDALPITEDVDVPFRSTIQGRMHACGHDLHTSMLVGAAWALGSRRDRLPGDVVFMFQPGEEGFDGAGHMIAEGVLRAAGRLPDAAYALHVLSNLDRGLVTTRAGALMAASDAVFVTVRGRGGHGSSPHLAADPVPAACEMVLALQTAMSRTVDTFAPSVLTVGRIAAGTRRNVIPETAEFDATVRTIDPAVRAQLAELVPRVCRGVAAAHGVEVDVRYEAEYPVTVNDADEAAFALDVAAGLFGTSAALRMQNPIMGAEDFSRVLAEVPGAMLFLGAFPGERDSGRAPSIHSPQAAFDDAVLPDGAALLAALAARRLATAATTTTAR
ncbi:MAG: amidohydrolase [Actinomycetales bacterium]|nr:amidohydrolase [Actinomycetales bacterium]